MPKYAIITKHQCLFDGNRLHTWYEAKGKIAGYVIAQEICLADLKHTLRELGYKFWMSDATLDEIAKAKGE